MVASWDSAAYFVIPDEIPTKEGYRFVHWRINGLNTNTFVPGDGVWFRESLELLAVWEEDARVTISESEITLKSAANGAPHGGEQSGVIIISATPAGQDINFYVEDTSIALMGYGKTEDSYQVSINALSPGVTYLVAEIEYNGQKYTDRCKITVVKPDDNSDPEPDPGYEEPRKYTLTLDATPGTVSPSSFSGKTGDSFILPTPVRSQRINFDLNGGEGTDYQDVYYVAGWSNVKDSNFVDYFCEQTFTLGSENVTLYARWNPEAQGCVTDEIPVKENTEFLGWSVSEDSLEVHYAPGDPIEIANDITLYAVWFETDNSDPDKPTPDKPADGTNVPVSCRLVSAPVKTSYTYKVDTQVDLTGTILEVTYSDGSKENITDVSKFTVNAFDTKSVGTKAVTIVYENLTVQYTISVSYTWWQWIIRIFFLGIIWY